jgi:integrase
VVAGIVLNTSGIPKSKEPGGRVVWLTIEEESAIHDALPRERRPAFLLSIHTGLRWSEQMALRWQDVDMLTGFVTVFRSKHGEARRVPLNGVARSVLVDLGSQRVRPTSSSLGRYSHLSADYLREAVAVWWTPSLPLSPSRQT